MHRPSPEEEVLSFVSKKLATSQLARRHSQSLTTRAASAVAHPSRVEKSSSRHASPKLHDKRLVAPVNKHVSPPNTSTPRTIRMLPPSRSVLNQPSRAERPLTWHPTSYNSCDPTFNLPSAQPFVVPPRHPNGWQLSSYEWPIDTQHETVQTSNNYMAPTNPPYQTIQQGPLNFAPAQMESPFGSYPAWYSQQYGYRPVPNYPTSFNLDGQGSQCFTNLPPDTAYPVPDGRLFTTGPYDSYSTQDCQHMTQHLGQSEINTSMIASAHTGEEELVGLGLYDRAEHVSPLRMSTHFAHSAPSHFVSGASGKGLKLEETWQPPLEWQPSDSTEGSEASASPCEENQRYSSFDQERPTMAQMPQHYPSDLRTPGFLFDNEEEWFSGDLKSVPATDMAFPGPNWFNRANVTYG